MAWSPGEFGCVRKSVLKPRLSAGCHSVSVHRAGLAAHNYLQKESTARQGKLRLAGAIFEPPQLQRRDLARVACKHNITVTTLFKKVYPLRQVADRTASPREIKPIFLLLAQPSLILPQFPLPACVCDPAVSDITYQNGSGAVRGD